LVANPRLRLQQEIYGGVGPLKIVEGGGIPSG